MQRPTLALDRLPEYCKGLRRQPLRAAIRALRARASPCLSSTGSHGRGGHWTRGT